MTEKPEQRRRAHLGARLAVMACLLAGGAITTARAEPHGGGGHGGEHGREGGHPGGGDHRGGGHDFRGDRGHGGWGGGRYGAPPVVYGSPYYNNCAYPNRYAYGCAPPVVYGPSVGIGLPGVYVGF